MNSENSAADALHDLVRSSRTVDLSVLLETGIPRWPSHPPLMIGPAATHEHDGYANQLLGISEHTGTHMDAPYHIHGDMPGRTIEHVAPDAVIGRCVVIDLTFREWQPGERATLEQIEAVLARTNTAIREGDIVLIHFGWMRYWTTSREWSRYADNQPGMTEDAADFFISRKVRAVGTDTAAVGTPVKDGMSEVCYFHKKVLRNEIYLIECLRQLDQLPPVCFFIALPLKIAGGSGSPIRAIALVP
ncbi:cyclase family protein [Paenibacillus arenilitoris]|uniref:Cyclase family protein n=1 Tax=Paenibacillus arenilitoris TaxID=2772299 RepID=A0A927CPC4_9BACL|nr:cyclase family protein [Paenibacillus arenilitoris]MBD2870607.1 cyclase family protein [Paenibacillus arenilitoris]